MKLKFFQCNTKKKKKKKKRKKTKKKKQTKKHTHRSNKITYGTDEGKWKYRKHWCPKLKRNYSSTTLAQAPIHWRNFYIGLSISLNESEARPIAVQLKSKAQYQSCRILITIKFLKSLWTFHKFHFSKRVVVVWEIIWKVKYMYQESNFDR